MQEQFQPDYPEMQRLKAELESARGLLKNETEGLVKAAYSEYQAARKKENSLQDLFERQKDEAFRLNSSAILYNSLKIEIEIKKPARIAIKKTERNWCLSPVERFENIQHKSD